MNHLGHSEEIDRNNYQRVPNKTYMEDVLTILKQDDYN